MLPSEAKAVNLKAFRDMVRDPRSWWWIDAGKLKTVRDVLLKKITEMSTSGQVAAPRRRAPTRGNAFTRNEIESLGL